MFKKVQLLKTFVKLVVFLGAYFFISQISTGHALAASTCSAGGTWVQADVWVKVVDYQGNFQYWSDNFSFNITALVPKNSAGATYLLRGDAFDNASGQVKQTNDTWSTSSLDFNSYGHTHSCLGSPAYDFTDGSNGNIFLNCVNANHDVKGGAGFAFSPKSVNDSGAAGGSFTKFETLSYAPSNQNGNVAYYFPGWSGVYGTGGFSDLNYANLITVFWTYQLPRPQADIKGNVYSASGAELYNVPIDNNNGTGGSTEDQNGANPGWFNFSLNGGTGFSVKVPSTVKQNGHQYSNPKIKPWGPNGDGTSGPHDASCKGNDTSYESQVANNPNSTGSCDYIPPKANNNRGYDIAYQKDEVPQIQGVVYGHTTGSGKVGLPGITIPATHATPGNCTDRQLFAESPTTDSAGNYTFKVGVDNYFCVHIPATYQLEGVTYSNLIITPFNSSGIKGNIGASCTTASGSYEWQQAEVDNSGTNTGSYYCDYGLSSNRGYDFLYQKAQRASIAATTSVSLLKAYPGDSVTFKSTAADSNTLPDDGTDTYSYSVVTSTTAGSGDTTFGASCGTSGNVATPLIPEKTNSRSCVITIPASSTAGTQYCITTTISNQPTYASVTGSPSQACVVVVQKPSIVVTGVVNGVSSAPAEHEIGSASDVTMRVAISCNDFIGAISYSVVSSPSLYSKSFSYTCTVANGPAGNADIIILANDLNNSYDPNTYVFTTSITAAAGVPLPLPSSTTTLRNYTVPYARFYGNDIASGSGSIYFNNHDKQPLTTSSSSAGSAAEYAAIAKTTILIATAAFRSTNPASPIGLKSVTDVQVTIASTNNTSGAAWANNWSTSGYYGDINGTTTINGASSIASKITIVGKDIYITGNITIDESKLPYTVKPFNNALIPVITLIADKNIYIDPSVTQIDALLQAGTDIYTCSTGAAATPSASCKNTLLVNGEVGAKNKIHFDRVCGTRLNALTTPAEDDGANHGTYMTNGNKSCSGSYKSGVAAEVINFPSYLYFASPYVSGATQTQYQSIYSAPPLL